MSRFCIAEIVVLSIGWLSNFFFALYAEGIFTGDHTWSTMDVNFLVVAAILATPYLLTFLSCWLLRRFVRAFLLLSLVLTIGSICAYYGTFLMPTPPDAGWVFLMVPFVQTAIAVTFSLVVFLLGLVLKPKAEAAPRAA